MSSVETLQILGSCLNRILSLPKAESGRYTSLPKIQVMELVFSQLQHGLTEIGQRERLQLAHAVMREIASSTLKGAVST